MSKIIKIGLAAVAVMAVAGFSVAEVGEYLAVGRNRLSQAAQDVIPLDVEIDRMEVLLTKLDSQVGQQKYAVAKSKIALEDSEAEYAQAGRHSQRLLTEMEQLRSLNVPQTTGDVCYIKVGWQSVSNSDIRRALSGRLAAWKTANVTYQTRANTLTQQRTAYGVLKHKFTEWQSQRALLTQRLETLKSRLQAQQLASKTDTTIFSNADLARATELADQIERQLRVTEAQQLLGTDPANLFLNTDEASDFSSIESEVDAVLENQLAGT